MKLESVAESYSDKMQVLSPCCHLASELGACGQNSKQFLIALCRYVELGSKLKACRGLGATAASGGARQQRL